jgi:hypothetical protein
MGGVCNPKMRRGNKTTPPPKPVSPTKVQTTSPMEVVHGIHSTVQISRIQYVHNHFFNHDESLSVPIYSGLLSIENIAYP